MKILVVLQSKLEKLKDEQNDLRIQVKEMDFHYNELLDLQVKLRKRDIMDKRHDFMSKMNNNAFSIAELERVLYQNGYNVNENIKEDDKNGLSSNRKIP